MKKSSEIKRRRRLCFLLIVICLVLVILWLIFRKKDYEITYEIDHYQITESYVKEEDYYNFSIVKNNIQYQTIIPNSNFLSKKLIYKIEEFQDESTSCIRIYSNKLRFYPLCILENQMISPHLTEEEMKKNLGIEKIPTSSLLEEYQKLKIYNFLHHDYYVWNYRGFYHITENKKEEMNLFQKDIYSPKLIAQVGDNLWVPDYNENFFFTKAIVINRLTGKQEIWNLSTPIYFDSVILGSYEDSIYIVDKHEKIEWKITPKEKKQEIVGSESKEGITYQGKWENVSLRKLMNQDYTFQKLKPIWYENATDGLYKIFLETKVKIRKNPISKIVYRNEDGVFYLVEDTLYKYTEEYGEVKIMSFFEWNFNSDNVIFIF